MTPRNTALLGRLFFFLFSHEIPHMLRNTNVQKDPRLLFALKQVNTLHDLTLFKHHFNIMPYLCLVLPS